MRSAGRPVRGAVARAPAPRNQTKTDGAQEAARSSPPPRSLLPPPSPTLCLKRPPPVTFCSAVMLFREGGLERVGGWGCFVEYSEKVSRRAPSLHTQLNSLDNENKTHAKGSKAGGGGNIRPEAPILLSATTETNQLTIYHDPCDINGLIECSQSRRLNASITLAIPQ